MYLCSLAIHHSPCPYACHFYIQSPSQCQLCDPSIVQQQQYRLTGGTVPYYPASSSFTDQNATNIYMYLNTNYINYTQQVASFLRILLFHMWVTGFIIVGEFLPLKSYKFSGFPQRHPRTFILISCRVTPLISLKLQIFLYQLFADKFAMLIRKNVKSKSRSGAQCISDKTSPLM